MGITFNPFTGNLDISGGGGPLLITDTFVVNSEAEMLALTVQRGDLAVRTDLSKTFILQGDDPTLLSNWVELATPPDAVTSVNTQVGDVVLGKADVGLGNVDNTSDLDKPISTATQDALDLKYDTSNPANYVDAAGAAAAAPVQSVNMMNGDVVITKADVGLGSVDDTSDLDKPISTATQDALDLKYDASNPAGYITLAEVPADLVTSVNGQQGIVQINAQDVPFTPTVDIVATDVQAAIEELSNDLIIGTTDVFQDTKEPTGYVNRTDSTMSFDDGTLTFTIAPLAPATSFEYYIKGKKVVISTTKQHTITTTAGNHFIYFDENGNLGSLTNFDPALFTEYAFTAIVYWNTDTNTHTYFADERHGITMDGGTHAYLHTVFGARFISGHALQGFSVDGDGSSSTHAQFTADSGTIRDEDIIFQSPAQTQIPILYRQGQLWRKKAANAFPVIYSGTAGYTGANGRLPYNQFTGGNWQLTQLGNGKYVLVHVFATNDIQNPILGIQGTTEYGSIADARLNANLEIAGLSGLPLTEFVALGSVIFQTADAYTNTPKASITSTDTGANYVDFRGTELYTPAGEATTHGLLSGLSSDDHLQYLLVSGTRAMTGDLNMGIHKISNVVDPVAAQDASTKNYVDTADNTKLNKTLNDQKDLTLKLDYQDEWGVGYSTFQEINSDGVWLHSDWNGGVDYEDSNLGSLGLSTSTQVGGISKYTSANAGGFTHTNSGTDLSISTNNKGFLISNLSDSEPVDLSASPGSQLVHKKYVDDSIAAIPGATDRVAKAGDTMTGALTVDNGLDSIITKVDDGIVFVKDPNTGFGASMEPLAITIAGSTQNNQLSLSALNLTETIYGNQIYANPTDGLLKVSQFSNSLVTLISGGQVQLLAGGQPSTPSDPSSAINLAYLNQTLAGNIVPDGDGTRNLGTLAARYDNIYANILKSSDYYYIQPTIGITAQDPNSPSNTYQVMDWTFGSGVSIQGYLGINLSTFATSGAGINLNSNNITLNSTGGDIFLNTVTTGTNVVVNSKIVGLSPGTLGTDAVNLNQLNSATSDKLSLSGGTMTGEINMGSNAITNASTISDSALNTSIDVNARVLVHPSGSAGAFGWYQAGELACYGNKLIGVADPVASDDAATKNYVDSAIKAHWDIIVGSPAEVSQGIANTLAMNLASAIASFGPQARVLVLKGTHTITGGLNLTNEILIQGQGRSSVLFGSITLNTGSSYSTINKIKVDGTVIINSNGNFFTENFLANGGSVVDNGSSNYKVYIEE